MKRLHLVIVFILLILFTGLGWVLGNKSNVQPMGDIMSKVKPNESVINGVVQDASGKTVKYWYDPMVPNQKFDKPGKSPFMEMQLAPKYTNDMAIGDTGDSVAISSQTAQNLGIRLEKVENVKFGESLNAVGRIAPDERRFYVIQTRASGFVERLLVRAVGDPVLKGQKIAEIYAPELLGAQQEYLALLSLNKIDDDNALKHAARGRLKLLGMSEGEIVAITKSGKSSPRFGVYAPAAGVVTELNVREGGQLITGNSLMQIADLSQVWLIAEIPERDAARLKLGIAAEVKLQSLPNEVFTGKVSYLYPILNDISRTLQVRIELPNSANRLRPGMYASVSFIGQSHEALSVSTESIIATGKRNIVIVKEANGYRPVEVQTGQERDSRTEILKGLTEGEQVVASGQFLIDSEASLSGVLTRLSKQDNAMNATSDMQTEIKEKRPKGIGKVVNIDSKSGKITLAHEPIAALGWPSMTMGFQVEDSKQLAKLKAGDQVEFDLKADAQKQYMIERIEKQATMKNGMKVAKP